MKNFLLFLSLLLVAGFLVACEDTTDFSDMAEVDAVEPVNVGPGDGGETAVSATYQTADCPIDIPRGYDVECGYLTVPENRTQANSPTIELAVAIVAASEGADYPPVIYLAGGPGGSGLDDFAADPAGWDYPFTRNRDLILFDQRGTGYSIPTLDCPEFTTADESENPDALCYDRLVDEDIDLSAYNTVENAADVAALREALGIEEWDLLGISYGTRLALAVMKDHPAGVRSVVLDSVFPPNVDTPLEDALSTMDGLNRLFADCAQDDYCAQQYPDLEAVFLEAVAALNEDDSAPIYGDDLLFAVSNALNDTELIPLLPRVIWEVADGNYDALDEISTESAYGRLTYQSSDADYSDSEGMYNSVICHDEYVAGDYDRVETAVVGQVPVELEAALLQGAYDLTTVCDYWNPQQRVDNTAVSSRIPTLILAGQYDVATPVRWARLAAKTLPNAYVYEFPGSGHSLLSGGECAIDITTQFLNDPQSAPDDGCIANMDWPNFE